MVIDKNICPTQPKTIIDKKLGLFSPADTIAQYLHVICTSKKNWRLTYFYVDEKLHKKTQRVISASNKN